MKNHIKKKIKTYLKIKQFQIQIGDISHQNVWYTTSLKNDEIPIKSSLASDFYFFLSYSNKQKQPNLLFTLYLPRISAKFCSIFLYFFALNFVEILSCLTRNLKLALFY